MLGRADELAAHGTDLDPLSVHVRSDQPGPPLGSAPSHRSDWRQSTGARHGDAAGGRAVRARVGRHCGQGRRPGRPRHRSRRWPAGLPRGRDRHDDRGRARAAHRAPTLNVAPDAACPRARAGRAGGRGCRRARRHDLGGPDRDGNPQRRRGQSELRGRARRAVGPCP